MNIAYVNNHYQLGGAETVVRQLHEGALAAGHDSRLHVTEGKSWPHTPGLRPLYPRTLARLDHSRFNLFARLVGPRASWTNRAFRNLAHSDSDLVHVHSYHGLYASLESFAAVARAKPLVWTFHRFWGITGGCDHPFDCTRYQIGCGQCPQVGRFPIGPVDRTADGWRAKHDVLSPLPLHIVAPSRHLAERVRGSALGRRWHVHVIPNGVNPHGFSGTRKTDSAFRRSLGLAVDKITALFVCRDFKDPIKGFPVIERALASRAWDGLQVVLAGEHSGWARARLPKALDVVDPGYIRDRAQLASVFEASDLFLYASDGENFPCVILEALSAECCVVSTPVDGVLEQVEHGRSGLIAADSSPDAFAAALASALALAPDGRRMLGAAGRERVKREFSESCMVDAHLALYAKILQENRSAS